MARSCRPTSSSSASASRRRPSLRSRPASTSTTASSTDPLRTSDPDIYAAGDVANVAHPSLGRRVRVEHWANALNGGAAAGRSMPTIPPRTTASPTSSPTSTTWAWSTSATPSPATPSSSAEISTRASSSRSGTRDGVVTAAMNVNVWDVVDDLKAIISRRRPVDLTRLTDLDIPLEDVAP